MMRNFLLISLQEFKDFGFNYEFEDVSHIKRSNVWKYFLFNKQHNLSKCRFCNKLMNVPSGTTSNLTRHLKSKHSDLMSTDDTDNNLSAASIVNTDNK